MNTQYPYTDCISKKAARHENDMVCVIGCESMYIGYVSKKRDISCTALPKQNSAVFGNAVLSRQKICAICKEFFRDVKKRRLPERFLESWFWVFRCRWGLFYVFGEVSSAERARLIFLSERTKRTHGANGKKVLSQSSEATAHYKGAFISVIPPAIPPFFCTAGFSLVQQQHWKEKLPPKTTPFLLCVNT